jgi:hypothetical protein
MSTSNDSLSGVLTDDVGEFEKLPTWSSHIIWSGSCSGGCEGLRLMGGVLSGPGEYPEWLINDVGDLENRASS